MRVALTILLILVMGCARARTSPESVRVYIKGLNSIHADCVLVAVRAAADERSARDRLVDGLTRRGAGGATTSTTKLTDAYNETSNRGDEKIHECAEEGKQKAAALYHVFQKASQDKAILSDARKVLVMWVSWPVDPRAQNYEEAYRSYKSALTELQLDAGLL